MPFKNLVKSILQKTGYRVTRLQNNPLIDSEEPFEAIRALMDSSDQKGVFFDVGANVGQTTRELKTYFPHGKIYAFEPGEAYFKLHENFNGITNIVLENFALGSKNETKHLYVNSLSDMSSFLPLGQEGWGDIVNEQEVAVKTLDTYFREKNIPAINLLKCDTQGFELEVLTGGEQTLGNTQFIFLEVNFREIYKGLPSFSDIYNYLSKQGFKLVRFYRQQYSNNLLSHADVLFYNPHFKSH